MGWERHILPLLLVGPKYFIIICIHLGRHEVLASILKLHTNNNNNNNNNNSSSSSSSSSNSSSSSSSSNNSNSNSTVVSNSL